ncbi:MAG: alpha-hydroxy-acid oxidizing protein, partial [Lachnospiraceae bacterium]|nr:alpha-hydroxy-acid oxidizing protein [Lachnospiraceae bacterium]
MTYKEVIENARTCMGPYCKACPECNGRACGNTMPGPGSKGMGDTAIRNFDAWRKVRVNMDTIHAGFTPDTAFDFFGYRMK